MKKILTGIFVILTVMTAGVAAQSPETRQTFEKGTSLAKAEKFESALGEFKKSLALAEADDDAGDFRAKIYFNIGVCLYRTQKNAEAVAALEKAVRLSGGRYERAFYALGMAHAELRNWRAAETAFRRALALNPRNGETWFDLAFIYLANGDFDNAQQAFQKSVEHNSVDSAIGHNNLGVILAINGDLTAAIREFKTALKRSGGKFAAAERNLQFCQSAAPNSVQDLAAKLEFSSN